MKHEINRIESIVTAKSLKVRAMNSKNSKVGEQSIETTDRDPEIDYEYLSVARRVLNIFLIPFLFILKKGYGEKLVSRSKRAHSVKEFATTYRALEEMYTYSVKKAYKNLTLNEFLWTHFWLNLMNCKAIRNRLKLVKKVLKKAIQYKLKQEGEVIILSIASGSARAIVETIHELGLGKRIKPILIDN